MKKRYRPPDKVRISGRIKRRVSRLHRKRRYVLTEVILKYSTSFIWLSATEITSIVEQVHDDIEECEVRGAVGYLLRAGKMEQRHNPALGRSNGCQFKKAA